MSYIDTINRVWELREQGILTLHEQDMLLYLIQRCNRLLWQNPFNQSTQVMCAVLGMSRNSMIDRRNKLRQLGLITFKEGKSKSRPPEYTLLCIADDTQSDTQTPTQTMSEPRAINKDKIRQDKQKENYLKEKVKMPVPDYKQILAYCRKRGNKIDARLFFTFYQARGWMMGRSPMTDWQAAVRWWEANEGKVPTTGGEGQTFDNGQRYEQF